jgi:hypothetical protein
MSLQRFRIMALALLLISFAAVAQEPGGTLPEANAAAHQSAILTAAEASKILPPSVYFQGQSAPVQGRNSAGVHLPGQGLLLISLIDTSGYSSQVQSKYQAYLITESPIEIDGHTLAAGAYGCGFIANNRFIVMDIGGRDLFTGNSTNDASLLRPKPLQILADQGKPGSFRLYAGRSYIVFQPTPAL